MNKAVFEKDFNKKTVVMTRAYNAPRSKVWEAWTKSEILDAWWGPEPWRAVTKSLDFKEGGMWLYAMTGPEGDKQWCRVVYHTITPEESFTGTDEFCNEEGTAPSPGLPSMEWSVEFSEADGVTTVKVTVTFASEADMQTIVDMGFEEGFTTGLNQLEKLLG